MKIAALYDIHGNLPALEAVLKEVERESVDAIVIGGDAIGGPFPGETLTRLQALMLPTHFIHGNGESDVVAHLAGKEVVGFSPQAGTAAAWLASKLTAEQQKFVQSWTTSVQLKDESGQSYFFCHAVPDNDMDIITSESDQAELAGIFAKVEADLAVCGHTHMQFQIQINELTLLNAGSVGMPFGKVGADWLIIEAGHYTFKHVDYDREAAAAKIRASDYPQAEQFAANNVLSSPTVDQARQLLAQLADIWQTKKG